MNIEEMFNILPKHEAGLSIHHNDHKTCYQTVLQLSEEQTSDDWISDEEWATAIETNEMWELMWYQNTPVAYRHVRASSLQAILDYFKNGGE